MKQTNPTGKDDLFGSAKDTAQRLVRSGVRLPISQVDQHLLYEVNLLTQNLPAGSAL